jgi:hypothetical protein
MCGGKRPHVRPRPVVLLYPQRQATLTPTTQTICYPATYSTAGISAYQAPYPSSSMTGYQAPLYASSGMTGYQAPMTNYGGFPIYGQSQIY